jgi:hypothetical protein
MASAKSWALVAATVIILLSLTTGVNAQTNVFTSRYDVSRDGLNATETILNQSNVTKSSFGKICSAVVDGQVFAQPLVAFYQNRNVVLVVTMNDSFYILDGTNCSQMAKTSLLRSGEEAVQCKDAGAGLCQAFSPILGVMGTPVVDPNTKTIYFVTQTESTTGSCSGNKGHNCFIHRLYAVDLLTLRNKFNSPVTIAGSYLGLTFTSYNHIQRPGLLLLPNALPNGDSGVYVGFSEVDGGGVPGKSVPQGWVFGFDAGNLAATPYIWSSTPQAEGGGVWQSGGGLAGGPDSLGGQQYIYFNTGDGVFDVNNGGVDYGDSFVKLTTSLTNPPNGYFTPFEQACMNPEDLDFGSGGVMLLPASGSNYFGIAAGKEGVVYVMNLANPGGYSAPTNDGCPAMGTNANQEYFQASAHAFYTTPSYWNQQIYYSSNQSQLTKYAISSSCNPGPVCTTGTASTSIRQLYTPYGINPIVSANGTQTGTAILWAPSGNSWPSAPTPAPAVLYAFDAEHTNGGLIPELWDSTQCPTRDKPGNATKFVTPTVANGLAYLGTMDPNDSTNTQGEIDVFGLTNAPCN